jgi:RsiW-degrading membrane proteinase PrsW (M82 family)
MRIDNWINNIDTDFNLFFGGSLGKVGAAARGEGFIATLDSYWLLLLMSIGIIGIFLSLLFMYEKAKHKMQTLFFTIAFFIAGFFITLTQSIPFLVLFPLLFIKKVKPNTE